MLADGLAQYLVWKQWKRWLFVVGSHPNDRLFADALRKLVKCGYLKSTYLADRFRTPAALNPDLDTNLIDDVVLGLGYALFAAKTGWDDNGPSGSVTVKVVPLPSWLSKDIVAGLDHAPEAFIGLLAGKNFGCGSSRERVAPLVHWRRACVRCLPGEGDEQFVGPAGELFNAALEEAAGPASVSVSSTRRAMLQVAVIMAVKGGMAGDVTVGDCLELLEARARAKGDSDNGGTYFYQLLHAAGFLPAGAPPARRAAVRKSSVTRAMSASVRPIAFRYERAGARSGPS